MQKAGFLHTRIALKFLKTNNNFKTKINMAKITAQCVKNQNDIFTHKFKKKEILYLEFYDMQEKFSLPEKEKVIVCFQSWKKSKVVNNQQNSFLVSQCYIECLSYMGDLVKDLKNKEIDFYFYYFDTFKEAFQYCIDLKEGL